MLALDGPSLRLGSIAQIPIKVHWTFSLFILFILYIAHIEEIPQRHLFGFFSYIALLFVFVIMHEYGHALTARNYGISTKDIIISPIGGIARLERLPKKPLNELIVAIAGPAVNVMLALVFLTFQLFNAETILPNSERIDLSTTDNYVGYLLGFNIVLVVFNLIPAFPMDGGRVLRSLLEMKLKSRLTATKWAVRIGQFIAFVFILAGAFWGQYMLALIGVFVFFTARSELNQLKLWHVMNSTIVDDILSPYDSVIVKGDEKLKDIISSRGESSYLVVDGRGGLIGALPLVLIDKVFKEKHLGKTAEECMLQSYGVMKENQTVAEAFNILNENGWAIAVVLDKEGNKKGVVDRQLLSTFISST